jgi:hypothetical protein
MRLLFLRSRLDTHSLALSTSFHPDDDAPNDARRAPTVVRRSTLDVLNSAPNRRWTLLDVNVRYTMRSCVPPRVGVLFLLNTCTCMLASALSRPSLRPLHRLGLIPSHMQLACFLSFAHVFRSSIRALADGRPAVTPMCVIRPLSPQWPQLRQAARARSFSLSHPPSPSPPHPRARPNSGAPINAGRAQLNA